MAGEAQAAANQCANDSGLGEAQAVRLGELELEVERLASRSEHLRAQNDVLSLTLAESRAMGERIAVLLGTLSLDNSSFLNSDLNKFTFTFRQIRVKLYSSASSSGTGGSRLGSL